MRKNRIYALIIIYYPDLYKLGKLINSLKGQVKQILLLNNGIENIEDLSIYDVEVLDMGGNIGIGSALNNGFEFLRNKKPEFVVTFDQDSLAEEGQISKLVEGWDSVPDSNMRKGAIGPAFYDLRGGVLFEYPFSQANGFMVKRIYRNKENLVAADALITSGMMIPYYIYEEGHKFNESLFIEFVDTEWCFRTLGHGFQHWGCFTSKMKHELSDDAPKKILGLIFLKYSPLRRYYYFRNVTKMITSNVTPGAYKLRLFFGGLIRFLSILLVDDNRWSSIKMSIKGLLNGVKK